MKKEDIIIVPCWTVEYDDYGAIIPNSKHLVVYYGIGRNTGDRYVLPDCEWRDKHAKLGATYDSSIDEWIV
jgi:hypothetical protein